ncbi:MAG: cysteine desulfurase, partial [Myxococcales bacterium]|nr:cysteine desulfurase [Myxococcales bacterium]
EQVASLLGVAPGEVIFTAGATESNNAVLRCVADTRGAAPRHLVTSSVEHPSVEMPLQELERRGWRVTRVPVDAEGGLEAEAVAAAVDADTALVSILWANNETGVVQPIQAIAEAVRARGVPLHVDATQAVGKIPVDLRAVAADYLSLSAHKFGGAKGAGCLVVRGSAPFEPLLCGGGQERGRRGGTENLPGIVGLGVACALSQAELPERAARYALLRDRLWEGILAKIPEVRRNGAAQRSLPNTLNVEFRAAAGEVLLQALDLDGIAVSSGAACASGSITPSRVLLAMGRSPDQARASLRFSVGEGVDESQIDRVLALLPDRVAQARQADGA